MGTPNFGRGGIGMPGNAHQAADTLRHQIETAPVAGRACAAEARDSAVDQPGLDIFQFFIAQPQPFHDAGTEVLNYRIRLFNQPSEYPAPAAFAAQVEGYAALVAIDRQKAR